MRTFCATALAVVASASSTCAATSPALVTFEQTGGFAGIERGMSVRRSGAVVSDGLPVTVSRLSPARLGTFRQRLVDARWATLETTYEADSPISDGYVFKITYAGRTIRVEEGSTSLPPRLARVYAMLERIAGLSR
jgi:hypothetical protein